MITKSDSKDRVGIVAVGHAKSLTNRPRFADEYMSSISVLLFCRKNNTWENLWNNIGKNESD